MTTNRVPARARGEARAAIVAQARTLFASGGYDGTTMRDIAQAAEVSEALLYRYFPAKSGLFTEAVIEPFQAFVQQYLDDWEELDTRLSNDEMASRFVTGLYAYMVENRDLLFALVAADRFNGHDPDETGILSQSIQRLADHARREVEDRGFAHVDLEMAVACTISMVFSMSILDDLLFPAGDQRPARDRIVAQMARFAAGGITY